MNDLRKEKVDRIAGNYPATRVDHGVSSGALLVIGWGSTYGALKEATESLARDGLQIGHLHLRRIHPFPSDLASIAAGYDKVVVAELNGGQLLGEIRNQLLIPATGINQVSGQPFSVETLKERLRSAMP